MVKIILMLSVLSFSLLPQFASAGDKAATAGALKKVTFQTLVGANANVASYALAIVRGYYEKEGLEIEMLDGTGGKNAAIAVAQGRARFGGTDSNVVADVIDDQKPIKILATLGYCSISAISYPVDSGIRSVNDLKGKKIGFQQGSVTLALFPALLQANGMTEKDVTIVLLKREDFLKALKEKRIDALGLAAGGNKAAQAETGRPFTSLLYSAHGVPLLGDALIVSPDKLQAKEDRELNCRFVRASMKGWEDMIKDPNAAVDALHKLYPKADGGRKEPTLDAVQRAIESQKIRSAMGKPVGFTFLDDWERLLKTLKTFNIIKAAKPAASYFTNEYLGCDPSKM